MRDMSEDEKREIRGQLRETYRSAKDSLNHQEVHVKQLAEGFVAIAEALRSSRPDSMQFLGESDWIGPTTIGIPMPDVPTKKQLRDIVSRLVKSRERVAQLEADLRSVGEWPLA